MKSLLIAVILLCVLMPAFAETPEEWDKKGQELYNQEKYGEALKCFDEALNVNPYFLPSIVGKVLSVSLVEMPQEKSRDMIIKTCMGKIMEIVPGMRKEDINNKYLEGYTLLHMASLFKSKDLALMLVNNGAEVNAGTITGETPLFYSMVVKNSEIFDILIANKANVNEHNKVGETPLHWAVAIDKEWVKALIAAGGDVNLKNNDGETPLHWAVTGDKEKNKEIVEILISAGADVNARTNGGDTPLKYAKLEEVKAILVKNGAKN